jgi:uncharacterized protein (DUF433 family)
LRNLDANQLSVKIEVKDSRRRKHMNLPDFLARDRHGYIHLAGHRIGLRHVVELYNDGYTPEMLHDHFPTLSLALIHKVIAFYLENQPEVDAYVQQSREALDRQATVSQSRERAKGIGDYFGSMPS